MAIDPEDTRPRPRPGARNRARVNDAKQACTWNPGEGNSGHARCWTKRATRERPGVKTVIFLHGRQVDHGVHREAYRDIIAERNTKTTGDMSEKNRGYDGFGKKEMPPNCSTSA